MREEGWGDTPTQPKTDTPFDFFSGDNLGMWGSLADLAAWNWGKAGPKMDLPTWTNLFGDIPSSGSSAGGYTGAMRDGTYKGPNPPSGWVQVGTVSLSDTTPVYGPPGWTPAIGAELEKAATEAENGGTSGGRTGRKKKPHWEESYHVADAPSWWKGMTANKLSHGAEQASIINAMIPFMSAKDQVAAASMLASMFDAFKGYKNVGTVPNEEPDAADRQWMGSKERMQGMLNTLNMMRKASGAKFDKGPGMAFMENVVKNMNANAAGAVGATQTRQQLLNMQGALSPFLAQAQNGALSPYASLVKLLAQPSYTSGYLNPTTQIGTNEYISGSPMAGYF